jgi:alkylation response protein AidB-like acyl-CoA dehydrogenase
MFAETQDQQLFERTTARFLETHYPLGRERALAGSESTFEPSLWRDAAQLGWTALLAGEDAGGGSVSGNGLADLLIVAFQFGRHAAPGPLLETNVVAAALGRTHLEASQAVASRAAAAVGTGAPDGPSWASAGMTYVGQHGPEVIQDCIQLHGGIGVTYDHDLHLFLRRAVVDSRIFGTPGEFAQRLGALAATKEGTMS